VEFKECLTLARDDPLKRETPFMAVRAGLSKQDALTTMAIAVALTPADNQAPQTTLDPYGQLIKMLMPRALGIAIYDHMGVPLWLSDACETQDLVDLIEAALNGARTHDGPESDAMLGTWDGDPAYAFIIRDEKRQLLGAVAVSNRDQGSGSPRPVTLVQSLLRPALAVLARELSHQYNLGSLQRSLSTRDGDLELLMDATGSSEAGDADEFAHLIQNCVAHLGCTFGALIIPENNIAIARTAQGMPTAADGEALEKTQRHLLAWSQVQRRTVTLNRPPPNSPLAALPYKILACPIQQGGQQVVGILALFKPTNSPDFELRHVRIVELLGRRVAFVLQNAYDAATGLFTRPAFEKRALSILAGSGNAHHCLVYVDIDRLHVINENHGMHVGDTVIARVGAVIRDKLGARMSAARISGDRFALLSPDCPLETAKRFAQSLCDSVAAIDLLAEDKRVEISASFGVAAVPNSKLPLSHALALAEVACKAAKDRGRARVECYQEADRSIVQRYEDVSLIGTIRDALANDSFRLEAQAIVPLGKTGGQRFELLLRMLDGKGESISPDKFFTAAERYQLATAIDRWVVQFSLEVISSAAPALRAMGIKFALNLSGQSLSDEEFPDFLEAKLAEYGLPPGLLSFEVTETAAVANIARAEMLIRRLRDLGHDIALDDFGRGLSSLTYLKSLPVTDLKIDGGLVRDVVGNPRSQAMISAIVQLAQAMKLRTTAECVESEAIQAAMTQLGVDYGQGFSIGRPQPLEIVLQELLRTHGGKAKGL
jgi:diguanylate cyclase (GGDEF)-like protein